MSRLKEAENLLRDLGIPKQYNSGLMRYAFLALLNIDDRSEWKESSNTKLLRLHDIFAYIKEIFEINYAENSRETLRKRVIHVFEHAQIVVKNIDDPSRPTNSGKTNYSITKEALLVIQNYGLPKYEKELENFADRFELLSEQYAKKRDIHKIPLFIEGKELILSAGSHNQLQVDIINEFSSRFAHNSKLLYIGDTADKYIYLNHELLESIGIPISKNDKLQLPDILLYDEKKNWLFLIEAVTTHGAIDQKRVNQLEEMLSKCHADNIYITAFQDRATFRKYIADIAWETEVWISEEPDHMIHFNGDKFMGPYNS
jgi:type II restriction enzyme